MPTETCLSSMDRANRIREANSLAEARYDFDGKTGVAMCCTGDNESLMPKLAGLHRPGENIADFHVPECDFCLWLPEFTDEAATDRGAAEAKLAEASYRCRTMFFSSAGGRPVEETVLRHTCYEHAVEIGQAGGQSVFMKASGNTIPLPEMLPVQAYNKGQQGKIQIQVQGMRVLGSCRCCRRDEHPGQPIDLPPPRRWGNRLQQALQSNSFVGDATCGQAAVNRPTMRQAVTA